MSTSRAPLSRKSSAVHRTTIVPLACLVQTEGILAGTVHYVTASVIAIGGAPDNDIRLDDQGVAPHHACIRLQCADNVELFRIYDLGSGTGVWVNGTTICLRHSLVPGDRIMIGGAVLEFFTSTG